ncbi:type IV pilin [Natronorubrum thiooxidans]|uniref:Flagellin N-terminal-like domain-containing protein n=1 Tax=Natronorubrum thiooxidans TaxID=308853 RepID=A0A1N7GQ20_9EURY|nr:type IV pilin N-terminal domain-containing protein [Natronorubrum thiooxidans]SIS14695.1 flagellin N-terminal-like domain-containing protein [Natronorubrum thiooxidans]
MGIEKYRNKLIGSEEERAVSPVIGVILMVAITVILAAVIAAFVLDLGDNMGEGNVNAGITTDVSDSDREVSISIDSAGDAEEFRLAGDIQQSLSISETGDATSIYLPSEGGSVNIVAVAGDAENTVGNFEWEDGVRADATAEVDEDAGESGEVTVTIDEAGDANSFYIDWDGSDTTNLDVSGGSDTVDLDGDGTGTVVAVDEDTDDDIEDEIESF